MDKRIRFAYDQDYYGDYINLEIFVDGQWDIINESVMVSSEDSPTEYIHEKLIHSLLKYIRDGYKLEDYIYDHQEECYRKDIIV